MVHHLFLLVGFLCDNDNSQKCAVVKPIFLCISGHFLKVVSVLNILRKWFLKKKFFLNLLFLQTERAEKLLKDNLPVTE